MGLKRYLTHTWRIKSIPTRMIFVYTNWMGAKNYTQFLSRANIKVIYSELIDSREAIINSLEFRRCFTSNERMQNLTKASMAIWEVAAVLYHLVPDLTYWKTRIAKLSERALCCFAGLSFSLSLSLSLSLFFSLSLTFWFYGNNYKRHALNCSTMTVVNRISTPAPCIWRGRKREQ